MNITARILIYDAYRQLQVLRPGQSVSDDSIDDAVRALNDLVDSWQLERLMVYTVAGTTYTIPAAGKSFTFGPGGTMGTTAPVRVESAAWETGGMFPQPISILTAQEFVQQRAGLHFDGRYPLQTMWINPPAFGGETLTLYAWEKLTSFADADTTYNLPPGYAQALRWNLACQLYPSAIIQQKIPQSAYQVIEAKAAETKGAIKSFHSSPPPVMDASDGGALGCGCGSSYNIYTDGW